jgi:hypothetical protein
MIRGNAEHVSCLEMVQEQNEKLAGGFSLIQELRDDEIAEGDDWSCGGCAVGGIRGGTGWRAGLGEGGAGEVTEARRVGDGEA